MRNGLLMVLVVLALLFSSVLHPLTILLSLPLSIAGAIMALLALSVPVTTPVVIGILMLMGIVTKNAIMLLDFAIEAMHGGVDRTSAIIDAALKRTRPILMTTVAMVAGMLPSALALGDGRRVPLADGDRGHRRPRRLDLPVAPVRAGAVHDHGRRRPPVLAAVRAAHRPAGGSSGRAPGRRRAGSPAGRGRVPSVSGGAP